MVQETTIRVRYKETDQMGIVYYGNYFTWFEVGRNEFFRELGLTCGELEEEQVLLPVIETGCKYISSAKFDEEVIIKTKLTKLEGVRLTLEYEIYRKDNNELLVEGFTKHAFVDKSLKPVRFRKKFKKEWKLLQDSLEKEE
ncbi:MAG: acyl-CoA thioesterase [Clostridiaceae bacterium]|nr:acyl-CoA thioesterase [Clostridiaceae bacterium]MBW4858480.1 acyl-CoA thioesterase [Clostridiaceae bacterium]MBW4868853.1 acyl-CoA thioesterase [Clostridiaceae bacterium]